MNRYFLELSYFGKNFNGWQIQKNAVNTVQQVVEESLSTVLQEKIEVVGCGRTDAGVHAKNYIAHFDSEKDDLHLETRKWLHKLNQITGRDIAFHSIKKVKNEASARFEAHSRTYHYFIHKLKDPFLCDYSWLCKVDLDVKLMNEAASCLLQYEDFTSFSKVNTQTFTNNCTIHKAFWKEENDKLIFTISANRFLRNMVRAIVGTLVAVGEKKITIDQFKEIIESKNRSNAGKSVPAHGLYLVEIIYPEDIYL